MKGRNESAFSVGLSVYQKWSDVRLDGDGAALRSTATGTLDELCASTLSRSLCLSAAAECWESLLAAIRAASALCALHSTTDSLCALRLRGAAALCLSAHRVHSNSILNKFLKEAIKWSSVLIILNYLAINRRVNETYLKSLAITSLNTLLLYADSVLWNFQVLKCNECQ